MQRCTSCRCPSPCSAPSPPSGSTSPQTCAPPSHGEPPCSLSRSASPALSSAFLVQKVFQPGFSRVAPQPLYTSMSPAHCQDQPPLLCLLLPLLCLLLFLCCVFCFLCCVFCLFVQTISQPSSSRVRPQALHISMSPA